jgi:hypothetical protein
MPAAGIFLIIGVVLVIAAAAAFLVPTIMALISITKGLDEAIAAVGELIAKTEPVNPVVADINGNLDAAVGALEGLLVKKAGLSDAMGVIDSLYPGANAAGLRDYPDSGELVPPRIAEVYTRGTLTLARLGREAPIAAVSPEGPVLRHVARSLAATDALFPSFRPKGVDELPRSPVIGTDSPVQYEPSQSPGVRERMPDGSRGGTLLEMDVLKPATGDGETVDGGTGEGATD